MIGICFLELHSFEPRIEVVEELAFLEGFPVDNHDRPRRGLDHALDLQDFPEEG